MNKFIRKEKGSIQKLRVLSNNSMVLKTQFSSLMLLAGKRLNADLCVFISKKLELECEKKTKKQKKWATALQHAYGMCDDVNFGILNKFSRIPFAIDIATHIVIALLYTPL